MVTSQSCPNIQTLSDLLDESLDDQARQTISGHVQQCVVCQVKLDELTSGPHRKLAHPKNGDSLVLDAFVDRMRNTSPNCSSTKVEGESEILFPIAPTPDAPVGKISHYAILAKVASGAHGVLYRARDERLQRIVALKVLRSDLSVSSHARARMLREAQVVASLVDDHIVPIYEVGNEPNFPPFLVMEFVEGETLAELIAREKIITERDAARIAVELLLGLRTLHAQGMIHRDIKPSNILLDSRSKRARLTDFGLARQETNASLLTIDGTLAGTPAYMSPEQVQSPQSIDARSDLYSVGVVLYEMLTGQVPFQGSVRATLSQVLHDEARPPRTLNDVIARDLETITSRAISKDANHRFPTAQEFIDELNRWLKKLPIRSRPVGQAELYWRSCQRNPVVAGLASLVIMSVLSVAIVSTIATWKLAEANRRSEQSALLASEQRDAALETLGKLVHEVQQAFEHEEIDLDTLQKDVLEIALNGLSSIKQVGDDSREAELHRADALRRMSEILDRIGKEESAGEGLYQSEEILRTLSTQSPHDSKVNSSLVETLWALAELPDEDDTKNLQRLKEALALTLKLDSADKTKESQFRLAKARYVLATELRLQDELRDAEMLIDQALPTLRNQQSGSNAVSDTPTLLDGLLLRSQILLDQSQFDAARKELGVLVDESKKARTMATLDLSLAEYQLLGLYLQGYAIPNSVVWEFEPARNEFDVYANDICVRAVADSDSVDEAILMLTRISRERELEDDLEGTILFDRIALKIVQSWLSNNPNDLFARFQQAQCYIDIAGNNFDLEADQSAVELDFKKGFDLAKMFAMRDKSDDSDWELFLEACVLGRACYDRWGNKEESQKFDREAMVFLDGLPKRFPAVDLDWLDLQRDSVQDNLGAPN